MSVVEQLLVFGPSADYSAPALKDAEQYCRQLACSHYENFPVVTWFLPRNLRQHFYNVYAFCRWADDLGDEVQDPTESLRLLAWWRGELDACYAGQVRHPVFVALKSTVDRFHIPQQPFADLISAFEQDQSVLQYDTFAQLVQYCERSANPVGRIVLHLGEVFNEEHALLSDQICTGLQLANFWQDVGRDYAIGRVYLPQEDRARFGYTDDDLHAQRYTPEFAALMKFEVERARELLTAGFPLVERMPGRLKVDIDLFISGGLEILRGIERINFDVWQRRPVVSKSALARKILWSAIKHAIPGQ